jgi:4-hydroxy-tetrahydrodipicolinate reductase
VIRLEGSPPIEMRIPGGLHGDIATAAIVVNTISPLLEARPGLLTMAQLPPPRLWHPRDEPPIAAV